MALLKAEHITKTYGQRTIIKDINIELHQGELVCLLGVSGSGKTTLFHILSGLTTPDEGHVYLNDRDITSTPGQISYMLQKDLLLPHKKIIDNVSLPLILKGMKKADARAKADPLFAEFGLDGTQYQYPSQLSGGMRQRAALIRTLALEPHLLLLDEPFSALDYQTRLNVSDDIGKIIRREHKTAILVTHDISEAISMADRVVILTRRPARIQKILPIDLQLESHSSLEARNTPVFKTYFNLIWKELNQNGTDFKSPEAVSETAAT